MEIIMWILVVVGFVTCFFFTIYAFVNTCDKCFEIIGNWREKKAIRCKKCGGKFFEGVIDRGKFSGVMLKKNRDSIEPTRSINIGEHYLESEFRVRYKCLKCGEPCEVEE